MKLPHSILIFLLSLATATKADFASQCYTSPLPPLTPSTENRTIPWGSPEFVLPNGTTCCTSLAQVRAGIDDVDAQLLSLLALRCVTYEASCPFQIPCLIPSLIISSVFSAIMADSAIALDTFAKLPASSRTCLLSMSRPAMPRSLVTL